MKENKSEHKASKWLVVLLAVLGVAIVALVSTITVVVIRNANESDTDAETSGLADRELVGLDKQQEILQRYRTESDYSTEDVFRDFRKSINECDTAGCRMYLRLGLAAFSYEYYEDVNEYTKVVESSEKEINDVSGLGQVRFYLTLSNFMKEVGNIGEYMRYFELYENKQREVMGPTPKQS